MKLADESGASHSTKWVLSKYLPQKWMGALAGGQPGGGAEAGGGAYRDVGKSPGSAGCGRGVLRYRRAREPR